LLAPACADGLRHRFLAQLLGTPGYRALHAETQLDEVASEVAAAAFAEQFTQLRKEEEATEPSAASGGGAGPDRDRETAAPRSPPAVPGPRHRAGDAHGREMAALRAAGKALEAAGEEVGELRAAAAAFGLGPGAAGTNDPKAIAALFRRVRGDPVLRRICD